MRERRYTVFLSDKEYFFSTDHCQALRQGQQIDRDVWVPCTFHLPMYVTPQPRCESGVVNTLDDYIAVFCVGETEIPNPDPAYAPEYRKVVR